jgi:hypothetical protein
VVHRDRLTSACPIASDRFFCLVCSDDSQPAALLRASVAVFDDEPPVIVTYPDWWRLGADRRPFVRVSVPELSVARLVGVCLCDVGRGAVIDRGAVVDRLPELRDPRFRLVSDYSSWLRLCGLGPFARVPEAVGAWRDHAGGETAIHRGRRFAQEHVDLLLSWFDDPTLPPEIKQYEFRAKARIHRVAASCIDRKKDPAAWLRFRLGELLFVPPVELPRVLARPR